mmetsp:Transcript_15401/g.33898  ORF Transcript_15401/g.33898 Transcript_15401/m.33898 type:complete len:350 (+) Transcript_15401:63-1112(+)|eukprot:CAMPEP_0170613546 /NCGR_PEP_ID=MMETSP0224-20130122/24332_1 /TAXON_ID=285029 /ORGANISM="Togula jolla, Strain CCCM 725" /LENGTH=349 /DNA_ID=CAMNT_0010939159 /DNA_START=58 /DNA_END=1107 /DNA_ORIENTATION=+
MAGAPGGAGLDWGNMAFSYLPVNCHVQYKWSNGVWDQGEEVNDPYLKVHIMANALHYGQALFEGQKVFHCKDGGVRIFSDKSNHARMSAGCKRLHIPTMTLEMFQEAIDRAVKGNLDFVPPYGSGGALYVRPMIFGSGFQLGLGPSNEYTFAVVACPVGSYYKGGTLTPIPAMVVEDYDRAAPLGVGGIKCAGNYAADIQPALEGKEAGFPIGLYLDAKEKKYIEEFNTSNFIGITKDGAYVTPNSESVLGSVTNKCLQQIAEDMGLKVEKRPVDFDAEIATFEEIGAVGTAVVVTPIASVTRKGRKFEMKGHATLQKLHDRVRSIQVGDTPDTFSWMRTITGTPIEKQ